MESAPRVVLGQIGVGRWGLNLLRNFVTLPGVRVKWACDMDARARETIMARFPGVSTTGESRVVFEDPEVQAVIVSAPAREHYPLAREALLADKHVFVEKPLALSVADGEELVRIAASRSLVLFVGHLMLYHPAVRRLNDYLTSGELGQVQYLYSQRLNLGVIRRDENVLWSLAPHDVSVMLHLLGQTPTQVSAHGMAFVQSGIPDTVFVSLRFGETMLGHVHVSWLDPHKVRRLTVVGDRKMAVFDDADVSEKLRLYDKGVDTLDYRTYGDALTLRFGDVLSPRIAMEEPLYVECRHFCDCVTTRRVPLSDGAGALAVLRVIDAAQRSLDNGGLPVTPQEHGN